MRKKKQSIYRKTNLEKHYNFEFLFRNYRQTCQQLSGLDLSAWQSDEDVPEFTTEADIEEETEAPSLEAINESVIKAAIEKAKFQLNERAQFEYDVWLNGMCPTLVFLNKCLRISKVQTNKDIKFNDYYLRFFF